MKTNLLVIKRNDKETRFNKTKIKRAINKAMKYGSGVYKPDIARLISEDATHYFENKNTEGKITITQIEEYVYRRLIHYGQDLTARSYEEYRVLRSNRREANTTDDSIIALARGYNEEVSRENSNKNARLASTQRDLIAGEVSKDISRRQLVPTRLIQAHDNGVFHIHDMDYLLSPIFNCCLVNIQDMLDNGTVINGKLVESPKSFQTACTVMTQIIAQISSGQYGGQSIMIKHLGKYLRRSYDKFYKKALKRLSKTFDMEMAIKLAKEEALDRRSEELKAGVQTIQYQINTLLTTNGQAPFVTLFMDFQIGDEYEEEISLIIKEILEQRIQGIKNEKGVYVTPSFPKLIYTLDEHNVYPMSKYHWLTQLAVKCSSKRLYPDYISAKKMREYHNGNVFGPMGCRSFLSDWVDPITGKYKYEGRFNMGVVSLNVVQPAIIAKGDIDKYWSVLEERLELCKEALLTRYELLKGTTSDISPIHWQYGGIARLKKGETIDKLLKGGYSTISLGYVGIYEAVLLLTGKSHTTPEGKKLAIEILNRLSAKCEKWKKETDLGFGLYGTPAESLAYRFARIDRNLFGDIKDVTDKGYYINSYHTDVREKINAFDKLQFESEFQKISSGGCISYIEIPNMSKNLEALEKLTQFIYENIQYAEFNTKSDYCHECGFNQEIKINDNNEWECPNCGNKDQTKMNVTRRTCGYLGDNFWNEGKTKEIKDRVLHL